ncbi:MAG: phosphomethylpyrimidine synthase ThiC, partial [Gammaproteobacteria bacterium]
MSAIPEEFVEKTARLSEAVTRPYPGSRKIYVQGSRPDLRVGMREIEQSDTRTGSGVEPNPPITVYDTSG